MGLFLTSLNIFEMYKPNIPMLIIIILEKKRMISITVVNPVTTYPKILLVFCNPKKNEKRNVHIPRMVTMCNGLDEYEVIASIEN